MDYNLPFLIIDSDPLVVSTLRELLSKVFPKSIVYSAKDGEKGWEFITKPPRKPIILSADKMPKMSGFQILRELRKSEDYKDSFFIALTGLRNSDENKKALQRGADDYLSKPYTIEKIITKLKAATSIIEMRTKLSNVDEKIKNMEADLKFDIQATTDIIFELQQNRMPETSEALENISKASLAIAKKMGDYTSKGLKELEYAARLCYTGKMFLPDKAINNPVMKKGFSANKAMEEVPVFARDIISKIRGFEGVANILYHIYENFDGSGFPDKQQNWEIPISSRILRVVMDFEEIFQANREKEDKTIEMIYHESKRLYDFKVVALLDQYLATDDYIRNTGVDIQMDFDELDEGMVLNRSLITESGLIILSAGMVLTEDNLVKISEIKQSDPLIGDIFVRAKKTFA